MDKKEMINKTVQRLGRGGAIGEQADGAALLNMNLNKFSNHLRQVKGMNFFQFDELVEMTVTSQTPYIAQYFAERINHLVVPMPEVGELDSVDMFDCHLQLNAIKGMLDKAIEDAKADGVFDANERKNIKELKQKYQATFEAFMLKLDALYAEDL
ncbi:YmfL family putative regulatory protein [Vibrio litoralis]|uniref:YmfL family putative regulatory protein n=1 Tax=Vibrio litoralis TaxID=335972 RepID=UPI0004168B09|nr:YmfL family putative regulatory protein [Vibrio litoralis]